MFDGTPVTKNQRLFPIANLKFSIGNFQSAGPPTAATLHLTPSPRRKLELRFRPGLRQHEVRAEGPAFFRDEALNQIRPPLRDQLDRRLARDRFLAHQAADAKRLLPRFPLALAQDVAVARLAELRAGRGIFPKRFQGGEVLLVAEI